MAGSDRSTMGRQAILAVLLGVAIGCSANVPKPLEAPAGTTESVPPPETNESQDPAVIDTVADEPETTVEAPPPPPASEPTPEPISETEPVAAPPAALEPAPVPEEASEPTQPNDESVVMIDTGARDLTDRPQTLAEAARAERQRRNVADPTDIVITDKTLENYATGDLTVATPSTADRERDAAIAELDKEMAAREAYWRGRALEIRQAWRDAYDKIPELEEKTFQLRQAFYREDDGFYRDGEIKPAWDRAIEQLEEARLEVEARQSELATFLEEGREAGALPGWLREGIDLEPRPAEPESPIVEPGEPTIYEPEASDPP